MLGHPPDSPCFSITYAENDADDISGRDNHPADETDDVGFRVAEVPLDCTGLASDSGVFADCIMGPSASVPWVCTCLDLDDDTDVDLLDFAMYQSAFAGSQ